jgi:hypothetical protein
MATAPWMLYENIESSFKYNDQDESYVDSSKMANILALSIIILELYATMQLGKNLHVGTRQSKWTFFRLSFIELMNADMFSSCI